MTKKRQAVGKFCLYEPITNTTKHRPAASYAKIKGSLLRVATNVLVDPRALSKDKDGKFCKCVRSSSREIGFNEKRRKPVWPTITLTFDLEKWIISFLDWIKQFHLTWEEKRIFLESIFPKVRTYRMFQLGKSHLRGMGISTPTKEELLFSFSMVGLGDIKDSKELT